MTSTATTSLNQIRVKKMVQNFLLVWLDTQIDESKKDFQKSIGELRRVVRTLAYFKEVNQCIEYMRGVEDKIFLIISGSLGQNVVPTIHDMAQIDAIFIFCKEKEFHKKWAEKWSKVRDVRTSIKSICEQLQVTAKACDHNTISMSFVPSSKTEATTIGEEDLKTLPPLFMYSVLFKEIILEIDDDIDKSMHDLIVYCENKEIPQDELNDLEKDYSNKKPVWWYTCESFLYGMLNRALRTMDVETMMKLGFFIKHLHQQLEELHQQQSKEFMEHLTVYRGQALESEYFQQLVNTKDGLLSFNNFCPLAKKKQWPWGSSKDHFKTSKM